MVREFMSAEETTRVRLASSDTVRRTGAGGLEAREGVGSELRCEAEGGVPAPVLRLELAGRRLRAARPEELRQQRSSAPVIEIVPPTHQYLRVCTCTCTLRIDK